MEQYIIVGAGILFAPYWIMALVACAKYTVTLLGRGAELQQS